MMIGKKKGGGRGEQGTPFVHRFLHGLDGVLDLAGRLTVLTDAEIYVPGSWACPKCGFVLSKNFMSAQTGQVGVNNEDIREVCPNDGVTLVRETWRSRAEGLGKMLTDELQARRRAAVGEGVEEAWVDVLTRSTVEPDSLAALIAKDWFTQGYALGHAAGSEGRK